jgi:3D (Asp-Asp-Asp) domain-containing protein
MRKIICKKRLLQIMTRAIALAVGVVIMTSVAIGTAWIIADGLNREAGYNQQVYEDQIDSVRGNAMLSDREIKLFEDIEKGLSNGAIVTQTRDGYKLSNSSISILPQKKTFVITYYTANDTGMDGKGITKSGTMAAAGRTIAVDPDVIPLGSRVLIDGQEYIAEDTGSAIIGNRIDIFVESQDEAVRRGITSMQVEVMR